MTGAAGPLVVGLPERVGRPARLGPFPSGAAALRFAAIASVGAVVAGLLTPLAWLPFLGAGLVLGVVRLDGRGLDDHLSEYLRWRWRRRPGRGVAGPVMDGRPLGNVVAVGPSVRVAVLSTGGLPVAFLPRRETEMLFASFRDLLRGLGAGLFLHVGSRRVPPAPFLPRGGPGPGRSDADARAGYEEMVRLLTRRLRVRTVDVVAWCRKEEPDALAQLESRVQGLAGGLAALGLPVERLEGAALRRGLRRIGWYEGAR